MIYNLKLNERQFNVLLDCIIKTPGEGLGFDEVIIGEMDENDNDILEINFRDFAQYYNAYLIKCMKLDEESLHRKLNIETYCDDEENNPNWIDEFEPDYYGLRIKKKSRRKA